MIEKLYEEELRYLYESGKEFARAHPDRARFLNIDAVGDRDPYVERLFEGFAFLSARIRETLDDSFPELTGGLLDLLWPSLLWEIPSLTIIELKPRTGLLQESRTIARGTEILSNPVGPESALCRFTTTSEVIISPLALTAVDRSVDTRGRASLVFHFQIDPSIKWQDLNLLPLRIFLHAELPTALTLHEYLTMRLVRCEVARDGTGIIAVDPQRAVTAGGLSSEESLLPGDPRAFRGYELLREYFVYPEKFLFVDINALRELPPPAGDPREFSVALTFDKDFPVDKPFGVKNFRLFCSPAVNLFRREAEPLAYTGREPEMHVVADSGSPLSIRVHSLVSVVGADRTTGERIDYEPLTTFKNIGRTDARTYTSHYRTGADGRRNCFVALGGRHLSDGALAEQNISVECRCSNGVLPREEVREGALNRPGPGFPDSVMAANITRPTLPAAPPSDQEYLWTFLSHLGANYSTLASADTLRSFLRLYDWSRSEGRKRRIDAIIEASAKPAESAVGGGIVRGVEFTIGIAESAFHDMDDLHLFGLVLLEFLSHYVSINSFVELVFVLRPSGAQRRFHSLKGRQWLL